MLIIGRLRGESIMIGDNIEIKIEKIKKDKVMVAIEAPRKIPIYRKEKIGLFRQQEKRRSITRLIQRIRSRYVKFHKDRRLKHEP